MTGSLEIERKFLVRGLPSLDGIRHQRLRQGYIATGETEVRLRENGLAHTLTCKRGAGLERREEEIEISAVQFNALWSLTEGTQIDKTRYFIERDAHLIELDVYHGSLEPLVVAEVEFRCVQDSENFEQPDWFDGEVTTDERYKNKHLALKGIPQ